MTSDTFRSRWARFTATGSSSFGPQPVPLTPPPLPTQNTTLVLDSTQPYLRFTVALEVRYSQDVEDLATGQGFYIAQAAIRRRAEEIGRRCPVTQPDRLRAELAVALQERRPTDVEGVRAWAACIEVRSTPEDQDALERYEQTQRRLQALRWQGDVMDQQMRQLGPLLTDPLRATAWWFAHHQDRPTDLVQTARGFRELAAVLCSAAGAEAAPDAGSGDAGPADSMARVIDDFDQSTDPPARHLVTYQLCRILTDHGHLALADRLRRLDGDESVDSPVGNDDAAVG